MLKPTYGIALTGFAAVFALLALTPASASFIPAEQSDGPTFYGMAELTHRNADGDIVASSTVHNRLVDNGESILIKSAFTSVDNTGNNPDAPRLICITDKLEGVITETAAAGDFTPADTFGGESSTPPVDTCITAAIDTTTDTSTAVMTATFHGSGAVSPNVTNILENQTIQSLAICTVLNDHLDLRNCQNAGTLFSAVVAPTTPTVRADDSVDVTYIFDITSADN
ncbi:hypothetical protein CENSYa_1681 [Cenarchaeum symbiosum A]|uniref:Uncharacterized protein n=1 Tax=Cenarchaeum symbiosum (strain A) TaxID=414004 RepID=A0RY81_CENSY|nr:hypothetical protein CENSYa_1681 [Cenarchaeum symbiosum A]